jgi:hypothetical protein
LRARNACLFCLSSRQEQPAGARATMREPDRIIRLNTVLSRTGLSRSTLYRKIAEGTFPPKSRSASTGPAGMNRTSTAGSQIPSRGVRNDSAMTFDDGRRHGIARLVGRDKQERCRHLDQVAQLAFSSAR